MNKLSSRRGFLRTSSAVLLGAASLQAKLALAQQDIDTFFAEASGEEYWQNIRRQFTFADDAVPMNAANLCPSFRMVAEYVSAMTADIDQDCSFNNRAKFSGFLEDARSRIAAQLNVSADEVALVRNTSEANNIINNGLALERGDEVIVWDENHPTNHVAWQVRAARFGFLVKKVPTPASVTADTLIEAFVSQFTDRTRVLALTHVSNVSGIKLPVAELVAAAHARGIFVHLDGAQTWGAMELDLQALGVDAFTASAHKWYMGPKEVGLLYLKATQQARVWPGVVASGWGTGVETRQSGARKFESLGQRDDAALAALGLTARIHDSIDARRTEERIVALSQRLKAGVRALGLPLVTPSDPSLSFGVCIVAAPDGQAGALSNRLYTEYGIAGAGTGGLRLCPGIYNTEAHVDRAIEGIKGLLQV
ncbi:aminotransferase class V-fold PLP-dependent enzyme [Pseudohongiella sp.]|uniref:Aminotransferase class V domain-containing protein n=1 Tax=marine sediment metagenome TaxID=412755 RepID=A0A0F9W616_9ZZZZ|nr:aminotransferase class V-fold PLP-dependent enzyme [Pseudohongiella sp.]HDZ08203.1 aminotransferase class V-fold PLP-dependent enzyme [Pseudohongiella sp.]HEA63171.1 aminotransferase class V-fold PLP-dependent enzyme [Pseudohongiella sp.]